MFEYLGLEERQVGLAGKFRRAGPRASRADLRSLKINSSGGFRSAAARMAQKTPAALVGGPLQSLL